MKTIRYLPPIVISFLALSVQAEPKQDCLVVLESLGYVLGAYTFLITYGVPWKGTVPQRVRIPPGKLSLQPVAIGADDGGNDIVRSTSVERVALGDPATMRAATRVNAEQASKPGMREPTRRYVGEGWHWPGSERQAHRLVPPGYWRRHAWKRGMGATREALSVVWHAPTGTP